MIIGRTSLTPWDGAYTPWNEYEPASYTKRCLTTFTCERPNFPIPWDLRIKKIIFNGPATIVMWTDGTKTVVKCAEDEVFDWEKAVAMAIWKKFLPKQYVRKAEKMICEAVVKDIKRMRSSAPKNCSSRKKK